MMERKSILFENFERVELIFRQDSSEDKPYFDALRKYSILIIPKKKKL